MKNSTTIKLPKKYQSMVSELFFEGGFDNHYVAYLKEGFEYDGSHTIMEKSQRDLLEAVRLIEKCTCNECNFIRLRKNVGRILLP